VYSKERPMAIYAEQAEQAHLFYEKEIYTDPEKASKVRASVFKHLSPRSVELIEKVFLTNMKERELAILDYTVFAFNEGSSNTANMLGHPKVAPLLTAERHLGSEVHLLTGFIRFADYGDILGAVITPKNYVLPFLASHFMTRFSGENFIIYDKTHGAALVYQDKKADILKVEDLAFNEPSEEELMYQSMWKRFYDTIGIKERLNPKCRMTHMPKRYWDNMVEMRRYL
jgi:probable DNA metabolism protein